MKVKVETVVEFKYERINELYGSVLNNFGFSEEDEHAFIVLNSVEDIKRLDSMLSTYIKNYEGDISAINWYFGLLFKQDDGKFILEIQDRY